MTQSGETKYSVEEIRRAQETVARIVESKAFAANYQRKNLFNHITQEALQGRGHSLKAYSIAVDALGKAEDFDPATDSSVRVEMHRLRAALKRYYEAPHEEDIKIRIPRGGYAVKFQFGKADLLPATRNVVFNSVKRMLRAPVGIAVAAFSFSLIALAGISLSGGEKAENTVSYDAGCTEYKPNVSVNNKTSGFNDQNSVTTMVTSTVSAALSQYSSVNLVNDVSDCGDATPNYRINLAAVDFDAGVNLQIRIVEVRKNETVNSAGFVLEGGESPINKTAMNVGDMVLPYGIIPRHAINQPWKIDSARLSQECLIAAFDAAVQDTIAAFERLPTCFNKLENADWVSPEAAIAKVQAEMTISTNFETDTSIGSDGWLTEIERQVARAPDSPFVRYASAWMLRYLAPEQYPVSHMGELVYQIERDLRYNALAMLEAANMSGLDIGDWDNAMRLMEQTRSIHRERDNTMFVIDTAHAIINHQGGSIMDVCIRSYSGGINNNIRMLACAELSGDAEWKDKALGALNGYGLETKGDILGKIEANFSEPKLRDHLYKAVDAAL